MKVRQDFVTNSSSSSFIIDKDKVSYDSLLKILLEIANKEKEYWGDNDRYTWDDVCKEGLGRYKITDATKKDPYITYNFFKDEVTGKYTNHYIIDNNSCIRYDWDAVKEVLNKYNIPIIFGNCD